MKLKRKPGMGRAKANPMQQMIQLMFGRGGRGMRGMRGMPGMMPRGRGLPFRGRGRGGVPGGPMIPGGPPVGVP